ncbi:MAG: hypothetical protein K6G10_00590 [Butyrivibrio sp.]|nr:hypothetical protein [Butyrivibrio sp.]
MVEQSVSYADQLRASRTKAKEQINEKKKLQYSFKKISSQIIRSKNSVSARKAVQSAKREVMRLKRLKGSGEYDEEELQLAIDHAKAMEKIAKKKVVHLEQEEMVERAHKGDGGIEERIEEETQESTEEEAPEEVTDEEDMMSEEEQQILQNYEDFVYETDYEATAEYDTVTSENAFEATDELMADFYEEMGDMLEEMDFTELSESLFAPDPNMSEDEFKMFKLKHRTKEMKEIAEADKEYLKGLMEHEKSKASAGAAGLGTGASMPSGAVKIDAPKITPVIAMPGAATGGADIAPTLSGGFDVSV